MTIIDRYLFWLFIKIFLVCFFSFTGLFVIVHLFSNLDELTVIAQSRGWMGLMVEFYGPRVAELFDKTAAVWTLIAAVFAVSLMQRRRETTAIEAAGVTKFRTIRAVFICALFVQGLAVANRELVLPQVKDQLVRTAQNWQNQEKITMGIVHDLNTGLKIRGVELSLTESKIADAEIQLPVDLAQTVSRIQASWATATPADENHPAGLWLRDITKPTNAHELDSIADDQQIIVYMPRDTKWLEGNQCFVVCDFDAYQAAYGRKLLNYQSVPEMLVELRKPKLWFGNGSQINIHSRFMQPVLEMSLLLLGLPLIMTRTDKNIFVSAGICFLIVGALQLTIIGCHSLGEYSIIKPAALAAWMPAILFTPLAVVTIRRIDG